MQVSYINSHVLPKGFRVRQYEDSDILALTKNPAELRLITDAINKYERQKDALVRGRSDLADQIGKLGFARKVTTAVVDGETVTTPDETEGKYISRFVAALCSGEFAAKGVTPNKGEASETEALGFLQTLADNCGETDDAGKTLETPPCYVLDIHTPERVSKPKEPNRRAVANATNIINNGSEAKWIERFNKGYKSPTGGAIPPIRYLPFNTKAKAGASPQEVEATRNANIRALAFAIMQVEEHARRNQDAEKEKEFA